MRTRYVVRTVIERVTVKIERSTRERLKEFGRKGETYDTILNRLMDHEEERGEGSGGVARSTGGGG